MWSARERGSDEATPRCKLKIGHDLAASPLLAREAWVGALAAPPFASRVLNVGYLRVQDHVATVCDDDGAPSPSDVPFARYELREGRPLRELLPDIHGEDRAVLRVAPDLAASLAGLHEIGLGHGDVKPDNILFDAAGCTLLDLGLADLALQEQVAGATPRYLGRGDAELGTTRDRDLLALGITLSEMLWPTVVAAADPLTAARPLRAAGRLGEILRALLLPHPGARPSARWVQRRAAEALGEHRGSCGIDTERRLRAAYLKLRQRELPEAAGCATDAAPWLAPLLEVANGIRRLAGNDQATKPRRVLAALDRAGRKRWLTSLVGPISVDWPLSDATKLSEAQFARRLLQLGQRKPPQLWTLGDVQQACAEQGAFPTPAPETTHAGEPCTWALGLARIPADEVSLERVEAAPSEMPVPLRMAAADVLRLRGEVGRALRLVDDVDDASLMRADLLRRSRAFAECEALLQQRLDETTNADDSPLRGCLARARYDQGDFAGASQVLDGAHTSTETEQVRSLLAKQRGEVEIAVEAAHSARALAQTPEQRARCAATLAFVMAGHDPTQTREGFREAALHAAQAGAVREEAHYLTGFASACVDAGDVRSALESATRAAGLFDDALDRPALASRAWLARAASFALLDASLECRDAATEASDRASVAGDTRAAGFAALVLADGHPTGSAESKHAALQAAEHLAYIETTELHDDGMRAAARLWSHTARALSDAEIERLDHFASSERAQPASRLEWWTARALRCAPAEKAARSLILDRLLALRNVTAPLAAFGKAMFAGACLAADHGQTEAQESLEAARSRAAQKVELPEELQGVAKRCGWLAHRADHAPRLTADENLDLRRLIHDLSERSDVESVLRRVLDVALMWTGAERGILLVPYEGDLRVAAARHLDRHDLGSAQLALSMRLATEAMASAEALVAADAMSELGESHQSVHALQLRSILVVPLIARGETVGVLYLDDRYRSGAFGVKELAMTRTAAPIAALAIADTRAQEQLRTALALADDTSDQLDGQLAREQGKRDVAERQLAELKGRPTHRAFEQIIGQSDALHSLLAIVERVAATDLPVLIRGESGTGKELIARAVAELGARADQPFVSENCGALPDTLLESTLFGHERGAFTGAERSRMGLFEAANGGTLFLDEVGEMSPAMQIRLLRVLEDGMIRPVGHTEARRVDVRLLAATHRDLEAMVRAGEFREDLYFRINVVPIEVPPLRARLEDVGLLVAHFLAKHTGDRAIGISPAAEIVLSTFDWPGNIRQLENEVLRALILCDEQIDIEHLSISGASQTESSALGLDLKGHVARLEGRLVRTALNRTEGNQTQAAKLLGMSRYGLHKMMKRLDVEAQRG